jgi:hypothetical protein
MKESIVSVTELTTTRPQGKSSAWRGYFWRVLRTGPIPGTRPIPCAGNSSRQTLVKLVGAISSRDRQFLAVIGKQLEKNKSQRAAPASMKPYFTGV